MHSHIIITNISFSPSLEHLNSAQNEGEKKERDKLYHISAQLFFIIIVSRLVSLSTCGALFSDNDVN